VTAPTIDKDLFTELIASSIIIAIVGYCVTLSMAKIYASKFAYKVDGNQELLSEVKWCMNPPIPVGLGDNQQSPICHFRLG